MQQKIREQSSMPETKHDLFALAKKLRPNLDREPKSSRQRVLVLHFLLLLNLSEVMPLPPSLCMKTTAGKRSFAPIVKKMPQRGAMSEEITRF